MLKTVRSDLRVLYITHYTFSFFLKLHKRFCVVSFADESSIVDATEASFLSSNQSRALREAKDQVI